MKRSDEFGEFKLIDAIRAATRTGPSVILGIGDDTAILRPGAGKEVLFTTDMLIQDRHFRLGEATALQIGRKALAVNISDIAAMGGIPTHAVAAVGLPKKLAGSFARELYKGIGQIAGEYNINLVGGDTNASDKLVLSVALLGECERGKAVRRSTARPGDVIFVTGSLGGSYASKKHLLFIPRIKEARFLVKNFKLGAMMDISDGLAGDIRHITRESGVGAVISEEFIPMSSAAPDVQAALTDGEDFELLFTLSAGEAARFSTHPYFLKTGIFTPIGKIVKKNEGVTLISKNGRRRSMRAQGYDHFKEKK